MMLQAAHEGINEKAKIEVPAGQVGLTSQETLSQFCLWSIL